jgi:hypothetical protein
MAASATSSTRASGLGNTERRDAWWAGPLATAVGLGVFVVYATFRAFYNDGYVVEHGPGELLSPFYSPLIQPDWLPVWLSPAVLILWAPGGFRVTCYYYRKAYYRAYFLDPPACAVGEPRRRYRGETHLFLFQNLHRYFLYLALIFLLILAFDVYKSCRFPAEEGSFHVTLGTLVLAANVTLLTLYTFSCHSLRHLVGGNVDCFSCVALGQARSKLWRGASRLNPKHMHFAWASLFMVAFADLYVWLAASGMITDLRIL